MSALVDRLEVTTEFSNYLEINIYADQYRKKISNQSMLDI